MEPNTLREEEIILPRQLDPLGDSLDHLNPYSSSKVSKQAQLEDPLGLYLSVLYNQNMNLFNLVYIYLGIALNVNVIDCRKPYIPFEEFYNETLSDNIEMDQDFSCYRCKQIKLFYLEMIRRHVK